MDSKQLRNLGNRLFPREPKAFLIEEFDRHPFADEGWLGAVVVNQSAKRFFELRKISGPFIRRARRRLD